MALISGDGFGYYGTSQVPLKWDGGTSQFQILSTGGRNNGPRLRLTFPFGSGYVRRNLTSPLTTMIIGVRINPESIDSALLHFRNFTNNAIHIALVLNGASKIAIKRGGVNGTTIGLGSISVPTNQYSYLEVKVVISSTIGSVEVRLNGATVPDVIVSGINTQTGASPNIEQFVLGADATYAGACSYNDLYVCDMSGTINNNFLGDIRIDTLIPNGDGFYQQFTPSQGSQHHPLIDEILPDITDFLSSSTTGQKETVFVTDIGTVNSIKAVQVNNYVQKSDAGLAQARNLLRSDSVDVNGATVALSTNPFYISTIFETTPASVAWTQTTVNAVEIGLENVT